MADSPYVQRILPDPRLATTQATPPAALQAPAQASQPPLSPGAPPSPWTKAATITGDPARQRAHDWAAAHPWLQGAADFITGGATNIDVAPGPADLAMAAMPFLGPGERLAQRAAEEAAHLAIAPTEQAAGRLLISNRVPTAVGTKPAPRGRILTTGIDEVATQPEYMRKLADEARASPLLLDREAFMNDRGVLDTLKNRFAENLDATIGWLRPDRAKRAGNWYPGAQGIGRDIGTLTGRKPEAGSATLAILSAGAEWPQNINISQRTAQAWKEFQRTDPIFTQELFNQYEYTKRRATEAYIQKNASKLTREKAHAYRIGAELEIIDADHYIGQHWSDIPELHQAKMVRAHSELTDPKQLYPVYSPEGTIHAPYAVTDEGQPRKVVWQTYDNLGDALSVLHNPTPGNISLQLGKRHKRRSFFNNINVPGDPRSATVDVQHIAGGNMLPIGQEQPEVVAVMKGKGNAATGITGLYPVYSDAAIDVAKNRGVPTAAGQAMSWEGTKGLFSPAQKRDVKLEAAVRRLWDEHRRDRMSLKDTQQRIYELARPEGALLPPEWDR